MVMMQMIYKTKDQSRMMIMVDIIDLINRIMKAWANLKTAN